MRHKEESEVNPIHFIRLATGFEQRSFEDDLFILTTDQRINSFFHLTTEFRFFAWKHFNKY